MRVDQHGRLMATAATIVLALAAAGAGHAADDASGTSAKGSGGTTVSEVTVTARKREERLQDVPVAITAISAEALDRQQVRDVRDIADITPSLVINPVTLQANGAAIYIRGFGQQDIDRTYAPAVSVVLDGVVSGSSTSEQLLNVYDLAQVEVLRGPQGTLFGPNSIGGVILLDRPKPTGVFGGDASMTLGSYGQHDFKLALDFPIVEGKLAGRITGASLQDDGPYTNDYDGQNRGFKDFQAVSGSLLYTGGPLSAQLTLDWTHDRSDWGVLDNLSNKYDLWCSVFGYCYNPNQNLQHVDQHGPNYLRNDTEGVIFNLGYKFNDTTTLTAITGYHRIHERKETNFDGLPVDFFSSVQPVDEQAVSQEVRLNYHPFKGLTVTSGLYYSYDEYDDGVNTLYIFSLLGDGPLTEVVAKNQRTNSYGVFTQADYQITDRLSITAGLRFTDEEKQYIYREGFGQPGDFYPAFNNFINVASGKHTWTEATPRAGINYKITPDILTYFSFAEGFKSGGFNGRGTDQQTIGPYNPETTDTYEVGFKGDFLGRRLRTNVAAFWNAYKNKQEAVVEIDKANGATITPTVNAGAATIRGIELELQAVLFKGFTIRANSDYLDAHYNHFVYNGQDVADIVKLLVTPKYDASITPDYRFGLGKGVMDASVTWSFRGDFETELGPRYDGGPGALWNDPRGHVGPHAPVDAQLTYEFEENGRTYKLSVFGHNLSNAIYIAAAAPAANLFTLGTPSRPRTFGVELSAKF